MASADTPKARTRAAIPGACLVAAILAAATVAFGLPLNGRAAVAALEGGPTLSTPVESAWAGRAPSPITASGTFTPPVCLMLSVGYQGHGEAGTQRWRLPVTATVFVRGTSNAIAQCEALTDANGSFCCPVQIFSATTVDVQVKNRHTLSNKRLGAVFVPNRYAPIAMGALLEGDANGDDRVSLRDFSIYRSLFGQVCPNCHLPGDFSEDGVVADDDFLLLQSNYAKAGPNMITSASQAATRRGLEGGWADAASLAATATPTPTPNPGCGHSASVAWQPASTSVQANSTLSLSLYMNISGGGQQADGADVELMWNPAYLSPPTVAETADLPVVITREIGSGVARYAAGAALTPTLDLPARTISIAAVTFGSLSSLVAGTALSITVQDVTCFGQVLTSTATAGYVSVIAQASVTATATPTETATVPAGSTNTPIATSTTGALGTSTATPTLTATATRTPIRDVIFLPCVVKD